MPGHHVLALDGPDALAFAQAQFSNDLSTLAPGQWQWSAWLNPKGRVIAVFALLRTGQTSLRLLLPDMEADELGQDLRRFVFRRKLTISPRPDLYAAAAFAPPALAHGASLAVQADAGALQHAPRLIGVRLQLGAESGSSHFDYGAGRYSF